MQEKKRRRKQRYNFLIDSGVYDEFSSLCQTFGFVRSAQIELFMKRFVAENVDNGEFTLSFISRAKGAVGRYNFLISEEVYNEFSDFCDGAGLIRSKMLEHAIAGFNEKHRALLGTLKGGKK